MEKGGYYRKSMPANKTRADQVVKEELITIVRGSECDRVSARELTDADMLEVYADLSQSRTPYQARAVIEVLWREVKRMRILLERAMRRRRR